MCVCVCVCVGERERKRVIERACVTTVSACESSVCAVCRDTFASVQVFCICIICVTRDASV